MKYTDRTNKRLTKTHNDRFFKAYNRTVDDMNNGGIKKYNDAYEKKLIKRVGVEKAKKHDYFNDKKYNDEYEKLFKRTLEKHYNNIMLSDIKKDKYYKKGQKLVEKYKMYEWDENVKKSRKQMKGV